MDYSTLAVTGQDLVRAAASLHRFKRLLPLPANRRAFPNGVRGKDATCGGKPNMPNKQVWHDAHNMPDVYASDMLHNNGTVPDVVRFRRTTDKPV